MRFDAVFMDIASARTTLLLLLCTWMTFQRVLTTDEPQFLVEPQSTVVAPQDEVTLRCEPRTLSTQILWVFNGEFITSSDEDGLEITHGRLHIRSFRHRRSDGRNQAGTYQCIARNSVGAVISREAVIQQAYFGRFESDLKDLYVKSTEGNVAVIPCHPPTGNPPTVTVFEVNGTKVDLKSGRYYVLPSGNLQISPVRPIDQGLYRCLAINTVSGQQQRAPNTVHLKVVAPVTNSPPKIIQRPPDTKMTVTQGQNLTLECVVEGAPVPVVTWDKYGGHLPEGRYSQLLGNLMIQNVQVQDQGTYICRTENQVGQPQAAIATVDVIEPPTIRIPPSSQTAEEGGKVSLQCRVDGQTDTIHWLHNAVMLLKDSGVKITDTSLTISNVLQRHAGMYQCVARSKLGSDYATARLTVLPAGHQSSGGPSPLFKVRRSVINVAPSNTTGRVGDTVELACTANESQVANIQWLKNDDTVDTTVSRYILLPSGTLRIRNLRRSDAGKYVCTVLGAARPQTVAATYVTIKETTDVVDSLDGATGAGTNSSRVSPGRRRPGGRRRGRKNRRKERMKNRRTRPEAQEEEREEGEATESQNEEPQGSAKLIPPSRPKVKQLSDTSVMLRWNVPNNDGLSVTFFKVQYKEMTADKRRRRWHTIDEDILSSARMYEVSGLRPGSMYKFRVLAVFSNNDNKQSPNSRKFTLKMAPAHMPQAPAAGPVIVEARPVSPSAISITWQYLSVDQAPIEGYFVYHKPYDASDSDYKKQTLLGATHSTHLLTELQANTQYSIKMRCFNAAGHSDESNTVVKKTLSASGHPNQNADGTNLFPGGPFDNRPLGGTARPSSETSLDEYPNTTNTKKSNELLYVVLGTVLGGMMLLLIVLMAMCAWRQQQQSRMMAAMEGRNKFDDPARAIHTDSMRKQMAAGSNGFLLNGLNGRTGNGRTGNGRTGNGYMPNHGQTNGSQPQMNISVNPMTELEDDKYTNGRSSPHVDQWCRERQGGEPPQLIQPPPPPVSYSGRASNSGGSASHLDDSDQLSMENLDRQPYSECSGTHPRGTDLYDPPDYSSRERWQHRGQQDRSSQDLHANNRTSLDHIPRSHERLPYRGVRTDPMCDSNERVSDHSHSSSSQLSSRHRRRQRRKDSSGEGSTRDQATNTDLSSNEDSVNVTTPCLRPGHSDSSHDTSFNLGSSPAPPTYYDLPRVIDYPPSDQE